MYTDHNHSDLDASQKIKVMSTVYRDASVIVTKVTFIQCTYPLQGMLKAPTKYFHYTGFRPAALRH